MKLTLVDYDLKQNIKAIEDVKTKAELNDLVNYWLETKKDKNRVFVCFQVWESAAWSMDEIQETLISHSLEQIELFSNTIIDSIEDNLINYRIYEFESYKSALSYLTILRETC